jgi:hypothetical protein
MHCPGSAHPPVPWSRGWLAGSPYTATATENADEDLRSLVLGATGPGSPCVGCDRQAHGATTGAPRRDARPNPFEKPSRHAGLTPARSRHSRAHQRACLAEDLPPAACAALPFTPAYQPVSRTRATRSTPCNWLQCATGWTILEISRTLGSPAPKAATGPRSHDARGRSPRVRLGNGLVARSARQEPPASARPARRAGGQTGGQYLDRQVVDTTSPGGRALFQMMGVFAEFPRCQAW